MGHPHVANEDPEAGRGRGSQPRATLLTGNGVPRLRCTALLLTALPCPGTRPAAVAWPVPHFKELGLCVLHPGPHRQAQLQRVMGSTGKREEGTQSRPGSVNKALSSPQKQQAEALELGLKFWLCHFRAKRQWEVNAWCLSFLICKFTIIHPVSVY